MVEAIDDLIDLIDQINKLNWLISDLHQKDFDQWSCALRQKSDFTSIVREGSTALEALSVAADVIPSHRRMSDYDWKKYRVGRPQIPRYRSQVKVQTIERRRSHIVERKAD